MQRFSFLSFVLIALISACGKPVFAENAPRPSSAAYERSFKECLKNHLCTTQEKLQILSEMTDDLQNDLRRIAQNCEKMKYQNCFRSSTNDFVQWHKINDDMRKIVRSMETENTAGKTEKPLNQLEPAAGQTPVPIPRPNRYTNPDQEQNQQNKRDWWHEEWSPPEEANPYHKW